MNTPTDTACPVDRYMAICEGEGRPCDWEEVALYESICPGTDCECDKGSAEVIAAHYAGLDRH